MCAKMAKNLPMLCSYFAYVYLSITEGPRDPHNSRICLKNSFLIFLLEVFQFSTMTHEKPDFPVLEEVKSETPDYSCVDDEDDTLHFHNK